MKRLLVFFLTIALLVGCTSQTTKEEPLKEISLDPSTESTQPLMIEELGIPLLDHYESDTKSRNVWDMITYDGKLYIGCGDADFNTGMCPVYAYDLEGDEGWVQTGLLAEEQIEKFVVLNNELVIPGCDPMLGHYGWNVGTFHALRDGEWRTVDTIPNGVHNFDMTQHDGMIYAGLAVEYQNSPIVRSADGGQTWEQVPMYRDGKELVFEKDSIIRIRDFLELNGELYAYFFNSNKEDGYFYSLYRYENDAFYYFEVDWVDVLWDDLRFEDKIKTDVEFRQKLFFSTEVLYVTSDVSAIQAVTLPKPLCKVWDLLVQDDVLYVLTSEKNVSGTYTIRVYSSTSGESGDFVEEASFEYALPMRSFELYKDHFYFGTSSEFDEQKSYEQQLMVAIENDTVGMILSAPKGLKIEE